MELDPKYRQEFDDLPAGYFEQLDDRVINRLKNEPVPVIPFYRKKSFYLVSVAASLALLLGVFSIFQGQNHQDETEISFSNIDSAELVAFEESVDLNDEDFEAIIPEATVDSIYNATFVHKTDNNTLTEEDIEDVEDEFSPLDEI